MLDKDQHQTQEEALEWIKNGGDKPVPVEDITGDIVLEGTLGIAETEALHRRFSAILQAQLDMSIDCKNLNRVDAAGVQLLYALMKEAKARSIGLQWVNVSDVLKEAAKLMGLAEMMGFESKNA